MPFPHQQVEVTDLWTGELVGRYGFDDIGSFGVKTIPGHGNFAFRFSVVDAEEGPVEEEVIESHFFNEDLDYEQAL